jgi:hypothetical protein
MSLTTVTAVHNLVANVSLKMKRSETEVWKWLRQQSNNFYTAALDAVV